MNWQFVTRCIPLWLALVALGQLPLRPVGAADEAVDFVRDIRPLLSDRCFTCHGPDAGGRATDLRLDDPVSAHALAITAGDPAASELVRRIESTDVDELMPPPDSNLKLSAAEKELFKRWIAQGGEYSQHWAFVTPQRPALPPVQETTWPRNEIDHFVLQQLEESGLAHAPPADPETLLRRVTLDLTGLPPTPSEIESFLAAHKRDPQAAYEQVVDGLLASERFGERMAVDWLDVARYADTYGYQNDRYRAMWPWRDWVVQAFNDNLPYDDFITWQIAGDLLPGATREQILATAFNRNHRQTNEGGSVEEEFRAEYVADRVNTFGAAFLGLTLECCRCHDHKYDPLTQREYYQLSGFFNNIDESGLYSHFTEATPTPTLVLATEEQSKQVAEAERAIDDKQQQLNAWEPDPQAFVRWRAQLSDVKQSVAAELPVVAPEDQQTLRSQLEQALTDALIGDYPLEPSEDGQLPNRVAGGPAGKLVDSPQSQPGRIGGGVLLSGEDSVTLPTGGDFTRDQAFTISLWLQAPQTYERAVILHRSRAWTDSGSRGYELLIEQGRLSAGLIHFWPGNAIRIMSREALPLDRWVHVGLRYDGSSRAQGVSLFVDGHEIETEIVRDGLTKHIYGSDGAGGDVNELAIGQRFRDVGFKLGQVDEIKVFDRNLSDLEMRYHYLRDAAPANLDEVLHNVDAAWLREFFTRLQPEWQQLASELRTLRDRRSQLSDPLPEIMVMREQAEPRATFILQRGAYDAPGEVVQPGTPASILPRTYASRADRMELAKWLVDPQHPLTSRVAVNRLWQALFGVGLVRTAEDFGLQGAMPSHPALLDWLSVDFVESGWDVKRMLKQIVMSATYRQSSDAAPQGLDADPENTQLARGPAGRLPAEMLRDTALFAGGLLVEKVGGPPVKPYQPEGLWEEKSGLAYQRDVGEGSHRRSLYTYWKRTSPPPAMMTLDASNREVCVVRRQVTMTPLQTLVLLNDPQYVEAARGVAEQAMLADSEPAARLHSIFQRLTGRRPTPQEAVVLLAMFDEQRQAFAEDPEAQTQWLSIGDHRPSNQLDMTDLAALAVVAEGLMSFDETVMKR